MGFRGGFHARVGVAACSHGLHGRAASTSFSSGGGRLDAGSVSQFRLLRSSRSGGGALPDNGVLQSGSKVGHGPPFPVPAASGRSGAVSGSGQLGSCRHETRFGILSEGDQLLPRERDDHDPSDVPQSFSGAFIKPSVQRALGLIAHPERRHPGTSIYFAKSRSL